MITQTPDCSSITSGLVYNFATFYQFQWVWAHINVNIFKYSAKVMSQSTDCSVFRTSIGFKESKSQIGTGAGLSSGNIAMPPTSAENSEVMPVSTEIQGAWSHLALFLRKHFYRVGLLHTNYINCPPSSALWLVIPGEATSDFLNSWAVSKNHIKERPEQRNVS